MRLLLPAAILGLTGMASADRIVTLPNGSNLAFRTVRAEYLASVGPERDRFWLDYGFLVGWDATLHVEGYGTRNATHTSFDFGYNFLPPLTDLAPGISVGMKDVFNSSIEGRAGYVAVTMHFGNIGEVNQDVPTEFTFGLWSRYGGSAYIGASLPFSTQWRLLCEGDKNTIMAGIEYKPDPGLAIKWMFEDGRPQFGLSLQKRF